MTALITYLGKPELKTAFLGEIGKHEAADALIKGSYGRMNGHFKGCAIGCSLFSLGIINGKTPKAAAEHVDQHDRVPVELGWPLWLAYMEDNVFEMLPTDLSKTWPRRLAEAMPVGVTDAMLEPVLAKVLLWTLMDGRFGVVHAADSKKLKAVVRAMGAIFERTLAGEVVPEAEWNEAARAARAAWAARAACAARAAWAARDAWAAWAAETRDAFYPALSEYLLTLLRELKPAESAVA